MMCDPYLDYDSNKLLYKKKGELLFKKNATVGEI